MAAWKSHKGVIATFKQKIIKGMCANGYSTEFAETCLHQIKGFSEYGFPESHAASFALLVYASAWLKKHYPAEFACALLNSQPMGFYAPSQIIQDAQKHGVKVLPIDANFSQWDCSVEYRSSETRNSSFIPTLRLGLRLVRGIKHDQAVILTHARAENGPSPSLHALLANSPGLSHSTLTTLARADAFNSIGFSRHDAHWAIQSTPPALGPLDTLLTERLSGPQNILPRSSTQQEMFQDYATTGLSLRAHPLTYLRSYLSARSAFTAESLLSKHGLPVSSKVSAAGLVITRQKPGTANGVVFITLEDETGWLNLIIRPTLFQRNYKAIMLSRILLALGRLERIGEVVYIDVERIWPLDEILSRQKSHESLRSGTRQHNKSIGG
jgi:error-prone DNA polymerase